MVKVSKTYREELMAAARKHARLAFIYAEDGAFATAAKCLHETAKLMEDEWERIQKILNPGDKK